MRNKAFTLIELLVVISIIGILSGMLFVSMGGATSSANDAKRKATVYGISKAILAYGALNGGAYPTETNNPCDIGSNCTNLAAAVIPNYISAFVTDPSGAYYKYYSYGNAFFVRSTLSDSSQYTFSSDGGSFSIQKNLLSLNQSNATEDTTTTGFITDGSGTTLTSSTTYVAQGTRSLRVSTPANNSYGPRTNYLTVSPSTAYTGSIYVKGGTGGESIRVSLQFFTGNGDTYRNGTDSNLTLTTDWQRVVLTGTSNALANTASIKFVNNAAAAQIYYADGLQLEKSSSVSDWTPGY